MADEQTTRARVADGAVLLDVYWPDWRGRVDSRLNMAYGWHDAAAGHCGCVLSQYHAVHSGQDEGDFYYGSRAFYWTAAGGGPGDTAWLVDHGFLAEAAEGTADSDEEYALLTRLWREELGKEPARG